jgi:fluoroquinolone transport system permease protein
MASFLQFISLLRKDAMLLLLCIAPLFAGIFFCYGIPYIEHIILEEFQFTIHLAPYYLLFDLLMATMTPLLYCFAAAYVILGEIDEGISKYFAVTPLKKDGYLISRLGLPTIISFLVTIVILHVFSLSRLSFRLIINISILVSILGYMEALLIVTLSGNKVEGMAVSKLSGLLMLGIPAPFFLKENEQYLLSFLPSYWLSKYTMEPSLILFLVGIIISLLWVKFLYNKFIKKIL